MFSNGDIIFNFIFYIKKVWFNTKLLTILSIYFRYMIIKKETIIKTNTSLRISLIRFLFLENCSLITSYLIDLRKSFNIILTAVVKDLSVVTNWSLD